MGLCCRTAALRIFVSSIAQINLPVAATAHRLPQYCSAIARSTTLSGAHSRSLQTSCARHTEDSSTQAADGTQSYRVGNIAYHQLPQESHQTESVDLDGIVPKVKKPRWTAEQKEAAKKAKAAKEAKAAKRAMKRAKEGSEKPGETAKVDSKRFPEKAIFDVKKKPWEANDFVKKTRIKGREMPKAEYKEAWRTQKEALKEKFPEGWNPRKRLSPDALAGIRALHAQFPQEYSTEKLSEKFEISPEAVRRILKAKWQPAAEEEEERQMRWFERGKRVWSHWAELGKKPPTRWRKEGIVRDPKWNKPKSQYVPKEMPADFMG
ncbi:hypothetical protein QBC43DRAFT_321991 [Cladorrhinum sp. PSN259]|nr:hypothetical protein QBC43DRAFT_321991 [Cladorrhinum sp. PSN259]